MRNFNVVCLMIACFGFEFKPVFSQTAQINELFSTETGVTEAFNSRDLEPESVTRHLFLTGNNWVTKTRIQYSMSETGEIKESSKYIYRSSADGNLLSLEVYLYNTNKWVLLYLNQYCWNNRILEKIVITSYSDFDYGKQTEYRYLYQNGLKSKVEVWEIFGEKAELTESRNFIYWNNNVIKEQKITTFSDNISISTRLLKYNNFGNLTYSESSQLTGDIPFLTNKMVCSYGPNQSKKSEVNYNLNNGRFTLSMIDSTFFNLDSTGKILSETYIHAIQTTQKRYNTYFYKSQNNYFLIKRNAYDSNGKNYGLKWMDWYYFDGDNLMNMKSEYAANLSLTEKKYKWDSQNRLLECQQTYNGEEIEKIVFSYETATNVSDLVVPVNLNLISGYPNPFNPSTTLKWNQPVSGAAFIHVTNILGQTVKTEIVQSSAGQKTYQLEMGGYGSGVYFVRIESVGQFSNALKLVLLK